MTVLLLRLAGPLQSWGDSSRFVNRGTRYEPTKSGIIGLIAAAQGRHRVDPIEDLARLIYGVRTDQPGRLIRDFQTAQHWQEPNRDGTVDSLPLSYRHYLADAVFVAGLQAGTALLEGIDEALRSPAFPLYLGRRSTPPAGPISLGLREGDLVEVLRNEPWQASPVRQRRTRTSTVWLDIVRDAYPGEMDGEVVRDQPLSFDPERRQYTWRTIVAEPPVEVANPLGAVGAGVDGPDHDPLAFARGA